MTIGKAKASANKTFILQALLAIFTNDRQTILIVQATEVLSTIQTMSNRNHN